MPPPDAGPRSPEMERLFRTRALAPSDGSGSLRTVANERVVRLPAEFARAFHRVLQIEKPGAWPQVLAHAGLAHGRTAVAALEREFVALGQPLLGELPLESCVVILERHFATQGWGRLALDLSEAGSYGFVVARLTGSWFVANLPDADHFTDALPAGLLQAFFEHVSDQRLSCIEIGCAARRLSAAVRAPHCTFVIAAPELLEPVLPLVGQVPADTILTRLRV